VRRGTAAAAARTVLAVSLVLLAGNACRKPAAPRAVVIVVVDALRADHLGLYGYRRPTSPQIDRAAREARVYLRAHATSSWTLPSFGSILTGRMPSVHGAGGAIDTPLPVRRGAKAVRPLRDDIAILPALLAAHGWATGAFLNNSWLQPRLGVARGFATYDAAPATQLKNRSADDTVRAAMAWLDTVGDRPFFLFMHFFEPHVGYRPPEPLRGRFTRGIPSHLPYGAITVSSIRRRLGRLTDADRAFITAAYDEEITAVDDGIARLFQGLRERGQWHDSLVIFTADHGEELFDHSGFEHGHTMYEELLHVPLVVWGPGVRAGSVETPVSLADLTPTVLEAAGFAVPKQVAGSSLWPNLHAGAPVRRRALFAEGSLYGPYRRALLLWPLKVAVTEMGPTSLFDLGADPLERHDLASTHAEQAAALAAELDRSLPRQPRADKGVQLSPESVEDLRSLGYVK